MVKKSEQALSVLVFPKSGPTYLETEKLPTDKDSLEQVIAKSFVATLADSLGEKLAYLGKGSEPADAILRDVSGEEVSLQIGEAIDVHRVVTNNRRQQYGRLVWEMDSTLSDKYKGVQVGLSDFGDARDLPVATSKDGKSVLQELAGILKRFAEFVPSLPEPAECKGKQIFIRFDTAPITLNIKLLRYAAKDDDVPPKWLWSGSHEIRDSDVLDRFKATLHKKIAHYSRIETRFWLVIFSASCHCGPNEENALVQQLNEADHPFDRVFTFFPRPNSLGFLSELYPVHAQTKEHPSGRILMALRPEDALPKSDDPRWCLAGSADRTQNIN